LNVRIIAPNGINVGERSQRWTETLIRRSGLRSAERGIDGEIDARYEPRREEEEA
jgi:hypothetical protein